ncbi:DUF2345 domain-containing protein [Enterobacter roggenkampii]|uniref:DUF2345 domain-containing protein n=1 Tax=Enterobacter roggenkampii TaxID=1812935 RepID=UPI0013789180|nr:DUF2345 domain-containing protein [Enterobacter roggenkampii]
MDNWLALFDGQTRYFLDINDSPVKPDVLRFRGREALSEPFRWDIEFTCLQANIPPEQVLMKYATFRMRSGKNVHGRVTRLEWLSTSMDQSHYRLTLSSRLALLGYTRQCAVYQNQSVPEVVEQVLRRHGLEGPDFDFRLERTYGKTQLNSGHLVDSQGQRRGTGSELRTDEWGTIRAGKGLFVSADAQAKAQGDALDRDAALKEIDRLNQQLQQLEIAAEQAQALKADVDSQIKMFEQRLKPLNEALLMSAPEGMALTSGEHLQMTAAKNVAINAGGDISIGTMGNMTALAGEKLGLFAREGQLSLKASEGPVDVQAQNASLRLFAEQKLTLSSASDISFAGKKRITLIGGGSYLRLEAGKVEYGTTAMYMRKVKRTMAAGASDMPLKMPRTGTSHIYSAIYQLRDEQGNLLAGKPYKLTIPSGQTATGYTDEEGKTVPVYTRTQENVELHVVQKKPQPQETLWFIGDGSEQQMETELREQP